MPISNLTDLSCVGLIRVDIQAAISGLGPAIKRSISCLWCGGRKPQLALVTLANPFHVGNLFDNVESLSQTLCMLAITKLMHDLRTDEVKSLRFIDEFSIFSVF